MKLDVRKLESSFAEASNIPYSVKRMVLFRIKIEAERQLLLGKNWKWGPSGLILKNWSVDFDANREPHNVDKIWAILT